MASRLRYDYGNFSVAESQGGNFADLDGVPAPWLARAQRLVSRLAPANLAPVPRNFRFSIHPGPREGAPHVNDLRKNHWISPQPHSTLLGHSASALGNGFSCPICAIRRPPRVRLRWVEICRSAIDSRAAAKRPPPDIGTGRLAGRKRSGRFTPMIATPLLPRYDGLLGLSSLRRHRRIDSLSFGKRDHDDHS